MARPKKKRVNALAADLAEVRERVRGLARLPASRIEGAAKNFRTHDDRQRGAMRGLHSEIGSISGPVVWVPDAAARDELRALPREDAVAFAAWLARYPALAVRIIDGHMRRELRAGQRIQVQVTDLDEHEAAKALATFDAVSDLAGVDAELLASLLADVGTPEEDGTADLLAELQKHLPASAAGDDEEEEPVIPTDALVKKWGTAPGQLWVVPSLTVPGREHRLLCGDCRDPANVERLRAGRRPKLGLHDPPYGISAVGEALARVRHGRNKRLSAVSNRQRGGKAHRTAFAQIVGDAEPFDPAHLLASGAAALALWGANHFADKLPPSAEWVVWVKLADEAGESHFSSAELAWITPPRGRKGHVRRVSCLRAPGGMDGDAARLHPTQKPEPLQRQIVEWYTEPGDDVEDWYMGAGAVIIACEKLGRIGHGMDIAHAYLAATLERLSARGLSPRLCLSSEVQ